MSSLSDSKLQRVKNPAASYGALEGKISQIQAKLIVMGCLLDTERTLEGVVIPIPATTPPKHNLSVPACAIFEDRRVA